MKPGETIKGRFEPERGKTAGFYLLGGGNFFQKFS